MKKIIMHNPTTIITSHINPDFDSIGSIIAAQKLYPNSIAILPDITNIKILRNFFMQSVIYLLNIIEPSKIDMTKIKTLVIVDTRRNKRIGKLIQLINNKNIQIHIFDHHRKQSNDIKSNKEVYLKTGSTVTILTNIIRKKNIQISPEEATIMCLGIYEDTGSFSFPSTTSHDLKAASFLISKGSNLHPISNIVTHKFNFKQIQLLNTMIKFSNHITINGIQIVITKIAIDIYFNNISILISKMLKIENTTTIFAIISMENKIHIIAKSTNNNIDVGKIIQQIGGGGHKTAATTILKTTTISQAEQMLLDILYVTIKSKNTKKYPKLQPVITISTNTTCKQAKSHLTKYNTNTAIVTKDGTQKTKITGYISIQTSEKAISHGLSYDKIKEYISTNLTSTNTRFNATKLQNKIINNKQKTLPITNFISQTSSAITTKKIFTYNKKRSITKLYIKKKKHA